MSGLLKFLPPQMVVFDDALLKGLNGAQGLLCMVAVFVLEFAEIEDKILERLIKFSGVTREVGKAIFSGVRAEGAMDFVKRLLQVSDETEDNKQRYVKAFTQFKAITEVRNSILHYGLERSGESVVTTNRRIALTESRLRSATVSVEMLRNLVSDLYKIDAMLTVSALLRGHPESDAPEFERFFSSFREPWLYIPPQAQTKKPEKPTGKGTRKPKQARKDQR